MKKTFFLPFVIMLCINIFASAQTGFKNQSVSIFKNASAFFIKSGTVAAPDKYWLWQSDSLPGMLEGTFWVGAADNEITAVKSMIEDKKKSELVQSYMDMLYANDGKRVRLYFQNDSVQVEGKIQVIKSGKIESSMYAISNGGKTNILDYSRLTQLERLEFLEAPLFMRENQVKTPTIRFEFKNAKTAQNLSLMYLQNNLSWNPEYKLELLDDSKTARILLQAAIINDAEDFDTEQLNLVAGVPNFKYATQVHRFIQSLMPATLDMYGYAAIDNNKFAATMSNMAVYQQLSNERMEAPLVDFTTTATTSEAEGTAIEDLYYYSIKNIQLKRGERALYPVFTAEVPVEHIYESDLGTNSLNYTSNYSIEKSTYKALHSLKIKNNTAHTWTSGSVMVLSNKGEKLSPVSQDALKYTSMGEERTIYLTEAPDVSVRAAEKELERKIDDKKINRSGHHYYFDLVTVEGEIDVQNFKDKAIRLDVKRIISGELGESSVEWKTVKRPVYDQSINTVSNVCWEMTLNAGEKKNIKYKYKMYILRYQD